MVDVLVVVTVVVVVVGVVVVVFVVVVMMFVVVGLVVVVFLAGYSPLSLSPGTTILPPSFPITHHHLPHVLLSITFWDFNSHHLLNNLCIHTLTHPIPCLLTLALNDTLLSS